ncbi:hypothetical protein [Hyphomonas sp.]|jgi:hypothetical protein|uniref:hypothetical protein n=1 Tax=Hyphomonas sp. TaxID=87 RepID=UPI0025C07461|nr:hypothetical protein [Hyphomonas sp.]
MKALILLAALMLAACATPAAPAAEAPPAEAAALAPSALDGIWDVTMFWSPTEPPSSTVMALKTSADNKVTGSFYESEFLEGEYSLRGDTLAFGSVTTDGAALYSHSGRFAGGKIEGQTLSHGRDFLMIWVAARRAE